jgi:hypothetical protein
MGLAQSYSAAWSVLNDQYPPDMNFVGAGCMFVSRHHVLGAIHSQVSHKNRKLLSGLGGKRDYPTEYWARTAVRETLEEIFNVDVKKIAAFDQHILPRFLRKCVPSSILYASQPVMYLTLVYSFRDFEVLLKLCRPYIKSSLYHRFPRTVMDVVQDRYPTPPTAEIAHILLWPRYEGCRHIGVAEEFQGDMGMLNHNYSRRHVIRGKN